MNVEEYEIQYYTLSAIPCPCSMRSRNTNDCHEPTNKRCNCCYSESWWIATSK